MTAHLIELVIVAIILVALYVVSKITDERLTFLEKKDTGEIERAYERGKDAGRKMEAYDQMQARNHGQASEKEPSFASKVKNEKVRIAKVDTSSKKSGTARRTLK